MKDYLLSDLNDKQREAVTAPLGPVLVLAGAGSGKTRALTYRIAYLIREKLYEPEEILALTFTNKAAGEMKNRIIGLIGKSDIEPHTSNLTLPITMGTFHSVCARFLRQDLEKLGAGYSRNFTIYDSDDSARVVKQIVLELGISERFRPQVFSYYISAAKNKLVSPDKLSLDNEYLEEMVEQVWQEYEKIKRENNALDFDDLLTLTYKLLSQNPAVLKNYQDRFRYILVDEYQDTNHVQYELLKLLVHRHHLNPLLVKERGNKQNIFVVGDDAQSIYGFRGANMQNILDFKKDYPKARVIMLEQNYRSTKPILDAANRVIRLNPFQYEKKLWTEQKEGQPVNLYEAQDENDEARFVLSVILGYPEGSRHSSASTLQNDGGITYESEETPILDSFEKKLKRGFRHRSRQDFQFAIPDNLSDSVILYRTHAQSRPIEEILVGAGVPYQIVGGIKFYERREIKDTIAYLRLLQNPRDLVSLERVINLPARGIGRVAFKDITNGLATYDYNYTRFSNNLDDLDLTDKARAGAREFFSLYENVEELSGISPSPYPSPQGRGIPPPRGGRIKVGVNVLDVLDLLLKRSGYKDDLLKDKDGGLERWENIQELYNVAGKFARFPWAEGLASMLEEVALMQDLDKTEEGGNKLTLMTLHSAKGLEWDSVFFVGLEEGLLPHSRSMMHSQEIAEEVRLAYVGMTRARKNLYLSYARVRQIWGEMKRAVPSRILKAIPKNLINKIENVNIKDS